MADFTVIKSGHLKDDKGNETGEVLSEGMNVYHLTQYPEKHFGFLGKNLHIMVKVASGPHTDYAGYFMVEKLKPYKK